MADAELSDLKRNIDLRLYAASLGYTLDKKESALNSAVMRHANGDKIIIKRDSDGHYTYFSVRDDRDNGTIVDFVQRRKRINMGYTKIELRRFAGLPGIRPLFAPLQETSKDRLQVERDYAKTDEPLHHLYLENARSLPSSLWQTERFQGRVRIDARGNAVFPHFDANGICGFEKKNTGYTGFSRGGTKGLWLSHELPDDQRLGFFESAIDALSYAVLQPDAHMRYASIGGKPNPIQPEMIRAAIARMPQSATIIAAMDADEDGRKLAEIIRRAFGLTGRGDLHFLIDEPVGHKDWNDQLRAKPQAVISCRPEVPSIG